MAATLPKRLETFVVPGGLKGELSLLPLPDILQHLRSSAGTGILSVVSGTTRKSLYVKGGRVVFASSNVPNDRLGEVLIRENKITVEQYEASIKAISRGRRQGKVLAATWAEYSPRLCPATNEGNSPCAASTRYAATLAARMPGCWISVNRSCSSGPSHTISLSARPPAAAAARSNAASASANAAPASGNASASALPMPTACDP